MIGAKTAIIDRINATIAPPFVLRYIDIKSATRIATKANSSVCFLSTGLKNSFKDFMLLIRCNPTMRQSLAQIYTMESSGKKRLYQEQRFSYQSPALIENAIIGIFLHTKTYDSIFKC
jgi:hypothetical protein